MKAGQKIAVLAGGVGAARLVRGLARTVEPASLSIIVNTGDDETFFGLHVSPDLDTLMYTLAGEVDEERGWGRSRDTFGCLEALARYYPETWFRLGDRDLATHIFRTEQLQRGRTLSQVTRDLSEAWGLAARLLPMSDDPVRTILQTDQGPLPFQEYLVRLHAQAEVKAVLYSGSERARIGPPVRDAIRGADLVVLPPSNPIVSIGPILSLPGMRELVKGCPAPVVGVSPIVGGRAVKGPADRMLAGLGVEVSPVGVAQLYRDFLDAFVIDERDAAERPRLEEMGLRVLVTDTLMRDLARSKAVAETVVSWQR